MDSGLEVVGKAVSMPDTVETTVYRIVQEGLNNARNHSEASLVSVKVEYKDQQILLTVRDNGRGFDVSRTIEGALAAGHLGLWGIRQRVQALGGTLTVDSTPGSGTAASLNLPLEAHQMAVVT